MTEQETSKTFKLRQICLAVCLSIGYFCIGLQRGFDSTGMPSNLVPNELAIFWIVSITALGGAAAVIVSSPLIHWTGRKRSLQLVGPAWTLAWIGLAVSNTTWNVVLFRALTGFFGAICVPAAQIYISECSDPKIRGALGSILPLSIVFGTTAQYLIGTLVNWRTMAIISALPPAILSLLLKPFPESPVWLNFKKDPSLAKSLSFYGVKGDIPEEFAPMSGIDRQFICGLFTGPVLVPFLLASTVLVFSQFCGHDVISNYSVAILSTPTINPPLASIIVMCIYVVFIVITFFLVDRYGRKVLLLTSSVIMSLSTAVLGSWFYLQKTNEAYNIGYLPLISLMVFISGYSIGYSTVPYIFLGEIIPWKYRGALSGFAYSLGLIFMFIEIKSFYFISFNFGVEYSIWVFSMYNATAFLFVLIYLPETKGKSLIEIEEYFKSNSIQMRH